MTDTQELVRALYHTEAGEPIVLSPGQDFIYRSIAMKEVPRLHIMCHTRFGKSLTTGLAVLTRAASFPEKWAIVAGTKDKAKIIMDYVIAHIFDNDFTKDRFMPDKGETASDVRRYRNKQRVTFKIPDGDNLFGEIFIGNAKDALGFGAPNVILDEAALVPDNDYSLVLRMLGDNPVENFMVKIGNPFTRGHFLNSYHDKAYRKVKIDCYQSLAEGRMTQETIDENRPYPYFGVLYECKFPSATEVDESGWSYLLTDKDIEDAQLRKHQPAGIRKLGVDIARGGRNYNVAVMRTHNSAKVLKKWSEPDLVRTSDEIINIARDNGVKASDIYVDDSGVGGGVTDILASRGCKVNAINFGEALEKDTNPQTGKAVATDVLNVRADVYAGKDGVMTWVKTGGQLEPHKDWIELTRIRYRKNARGQTVIEPKEEMRKRGVESPDVADALALTFAKVKNKLYTNTIDPATILAGGVQPFFPGMPG